MADDAHVQGVGAAAVERVRMKMGWLVFLALLALLLGAEPLGYLFARIYWWGPWADQIPQGFVLVCCIVWAALLLGGLAATATFRLAMGSAGAVPVVWLWMLVVVIFSGSGVGFGLAWLVYMFCWRA